MLSILWWGIFVDEKGVQHEFKVWFNGRNYDDCHQQTIDFVNDKLLRNDWYLESNEIADVVDTRC
jgi:hypothetical protein